jgi:hypothetical protein
MNTTKNITTEQLENILLGMDNTQSTAISVTQFTEPKILKKDRVTKEAVTFTSVKKLTKLNALLNTNYAKGVETQLERENKSKDEYKKGQNTMPIDKSMSNNNFCGTFYGKVVIEYRPFDKSYPKTKFIADGKLIDKDKLGDILPKSSSATNQGTDKEIFWRKLYVKNIRRISIGGKKYKVVNPS